MRVRYKILATMATATGLLVGCDRLFSDDIMSGTVVKKASTQKYVGTSDEYTQGELVVDVNKDNVADYELVLPWPPDTTLFKYAQVGHVVTFENQDNKSRFLVSSGNPLVMNKIFTINGIDAKQIREKYSKQR